MKTATEERREKAVEIAKSLYSQGESIETIREIAKIMIEIMEKALANGENTIGRISNGGLIIE